MSIRPSELLAIKDDLVRFYFDRAVWRFGVSVTADLESVDLNSDSVEFQRQQILETWLNVKSDSTDFVPKGRFRDPFVST